MKRFITKHGSKLVGAGVGILGGYLYYYYVGCVSGTCPITSNPYRMMIYGALMGYLLSEIIFNNRSSKKTAEVPADNDINEK